MQLTLIKNTDTSATLTYRIARIVYAHTCAKSLPLVEAFSSMIQNMSNKSGVDILEIISDKNIFDALDSRSPRNSYMNVSADNRGFQMCVRTVRRMLMGGLPDCCNGATQFHYCDVIPDWAVARGYIADIDGVLFYL